MGRRVWLMLVASLLVAAVAPSAASAVGGPPGDDDVVYLSLGDSLAAGSLANPNGTTVYPSNKSYTDVLYQRLRSRVDKDFVHVKLGCDGYKTSDMLEDPGDGKCTYSTGTQVGDAVEWLKTGDVALVTIDVGANDVNSAANSCGFGNTGCILAAMAETAGRLDVILDELTDWYDGPIVAMNYYNPHAAASIGYVSGSPIGPPLLPFAIASTELVWALNNLFLGPTYAAYEVLVVDVFALFATDDFADDGGRYQIAGNGIPDNADALCRLTYACPSKPGADSNQHPTRRGYKAIADAFWLIVRTLDLS